MKSLTAGLPDADRNRLVQLVAEARSHWTPHHLKLMVGQLAGEATEFRAAALLEFAKVDLAHRWQRDEQILVESYLGQFKELQHSPAVVRDLLQVEIAARRNAGAAPDEQELRNRFPMLGDEVAHVLSESRSRSSEKNVTDEAGQNLAKSTASLASAETIAPNKQTVPPVEDASGELFDHYRLIKELGHGAMGTVYLAEDTKLRRCVALKRPRIAGAEEAAVLQRFYREAYAAATLNHPNICPVYDIGEFNGIPYITMACIEGRTLAQVIRNGKPLNPRAVAGLVRKLALALSEAHQHGIIHRDLKPGNIMLNQRSEPIVMDFGLARQLDADVEDRLTTDGMLVGTLAYMSPEQVEGDLSRIGPATDIYSLGVVLFELLTGRIPFQGSAGSVIRQIASVAPPAPSALRENVPQELEAICLRMLAKAVNARYASMADVALSLTEWLKSKGEPASMAAPPPVDEILPAQLEARRKQIERMIDAGQWREASLQLQRMIALEQPAAVPFVAWARDQETALHVRWEQEQRAAARLLANAQEDFSRHDYAAAAQRLAKIDKPLLTVEGKQLLDESLKLAEEVDLLIHMLEQGLHGGSQAGMFRNMQRLLQLKPRDPLVRDLYRKFRWQQRLGWIGATLADAFALTGSSRMRTTIEDPMYRKWFVLAALVFLISFGLMSWHVAAYLRSTKQPPKIEVGFAEFTETPPPGAYALERDLDDRVDVDSLLYDGSHPITMEAWVKLRSTANGWNSPLAWFTQNYDGSGSPISKGIYVLAACDSNKPDTNTWYIATNATYKSTETAAAAEKWVHVAVVVAGVKLKFFLDGKLVHERDIPEPVLVPDMPFAIGEAQVVPESQKHEPTPRYAGYHDFFGQLDEIRVSKVVRYSADFTPALRFEPDADTLALFHCDEGSGEQLIDSSGNEHHGTVQRIEWVASTDEEKLRHLYPDSTSPPPSDGNLVADASFEGLLPVGMGLKVFEDSPMGKWNVTGSVEVNNSWQAYDGTISTDMNGFYKGAIWQSIKTVPNQSYRLSFAAATNAHISSPSHLRVWWNFEEIATLTLEKEGRTLTDMKWKVHEFDVLAAGPQSLLKFESLDEGVGGGPALDAISLVPNAGKVPTAVPSTPTVNLFNGRDLTGWTASGNAAWKVENNTIVCTSTSRDVLWTDVEYGDFDLELEVRLASEANSGVFLRAPRRHLTLGKDEFEIQLNDDSAPRSSNLASNVISGAIYNVSAARSRAYRSGQWNKLRIRAVKRHLQVWLNDLLVQDCNLDDFREEFASHPALARERGFIGLQSPISNRVEFRNLKLTAF